MTDLPRYHTGQLGPINFQTINEMMRRLDALRPLIESASVDSARPAYEVESVLPVYANAPKSPQPPFAGRYDWREIIVRGESTSAIPVSGSYDSIANEDDADWDDIESNAQYRSGTVWIETGKGGGLEESDNYAISIDQGFFEGFATLFVFRRTDSSRVYVLFPIGAGGDNMQLIRIESLQGQIQINTQGSTDFISGHSYTGRVVTIASDASSISISDESVVLLDFGLNPPTKNKPTIIPAGPSLTERTLDPQSIILAKQLPGSSIFVSSTLTHFDVSCT